VADLVSHDHYYPEIGIGSENKSKNYPEIGTENKTKNGLVHLRQQCMTSREKIVEL